MGGRSPSAGVRAGMETLLSLGAWPSPQVCFLHHSPGICPPPPAPGLEPWLCHVFSVPSLTAGLLGCERRGGVLRGLNGGSRGHALCMLGPWLPAVRVQLRPSSFLSLLSSSLLFAWTSAGAGRNQWTKRNGVNNWDSEFVLLLR